MRLPWKRDDALAGEVQALRTDVADLREHMRSTLEIIDVERARDANTRFADLETLVTETESAVRDELRNFERTTPEADAFDNLRDEVNGHEVQINDLDHRLTAVETLAENAQRDALGLDDDEQGSA